MNTCIRFTLVVALMLATTTAAVASYRTPINLDNTGTGNIEQNQVLVQIDTASLRVSGVIASDSCADVAFYYGATRLNHWFETSCPGPSGGVTNVWIQTPLAAGVVKTVQMVSGAGSTGDEIDWGGQFVLANGAANCPVDWILQSAMADYFPIPGAASWGTTAAGGHTHTIDGFLDYEETPVLDAGIDYGFSPYVDKAVHTHRIVMETSLPSDGGLPPYVDVPFCGKGKLDIRENMLGLFAGTGLPGGVDPVLNQHGRFWRGSTGSFGQTGGAATHTHTAEGNSEITFDPQVLGDQYITNSTSNHRHHVTVTTAPASSLPPYLDLIPGLLPEGFAASAEPLLVFADQAPPLGWQPFAAAAGRYLQMNASAGATGGDPHRHTIDPANDGSTLEISAPLISVYSASGEDPAAEFVADRVHTHNGALEENPVPVNLQLNHPPSFGVQLYWRISQTGLMVTVAPAALPGAPTIGSATSADSSVSVAFTPPSDNGGAAIDSYRASCTSSITATGTGSPITVIGLTNGAAYTCTVAAHNSAGWGDDSVASNSVTPKGSQSIDFANPGPQNFGASPTLSATADSGLSVTFTSTTTGVCTITAGGTLSFLTIGICAIGADQVGDASFAAAPTVSQSFAVNAVPPGAPANAVAAAGNSSARVAFTPTIINGGAVIDSYRATCTGGFFAAGSGSPLTVTGLINGEAYTCTVAAHNAAGWGNESTASNSVTPSVTPELYVTPSKTGGGTISPSTLQVVRQGSTITFTAIPVSGYSVAVGGTCGGLLSGSTYTTKPITVDCSVIAFFRSSFPWTMFLPAISMGE